MEGKKIMSSIIVAGQAEKIYMTSGRKKERKKERVNMLQKNW